MKWADSTDSDEECCNQGRARKESYGTYTKAFVCDTFVRNRHRHTLHTAIAWAQQHKDHHGLYTYNAQSGAEHYKSARYDTTGYD